MGTEAKRSLIGPIMFAAMVIAIAGVLRWAVSAWLHTVDTYGFFYMGIFVACFYRGFPAGVAALFFAGIATTLLLKGRFTFSIEDPGDQFEWALFIASGLVTCILFETRDRALAHARQARRALEAFIDAAPVGIAIFDRGMRFAVVNRKLAEIDGMPVEAHLGKSFDALFPEIAPIVRPMFETVLATGKPLPAFEFESAASVQAGVRHVWESWFPVRDDVTGSAVGAVVLDITHQRRYEAALNQAARDKDHFVRVLAHELKTPIGTAGLIAEVLKANPADAGKVAEVARTLSRQVESLNRIIGDVFDITRISSGKLTLCLEEFDINEVVAQCAELARSKCRKKDQNLQLYLGRKATVMGDRLRLEQAISNLLDNASKYTHRGGKITVATDLEGPCALVRIEDNGIGIASDQFDSIFKMYARGEEASNFAGGLGIGLGVVKEVVALHQGTVNVKSSGQGSGSAFEVRLPLSAPAESAVAPLSQ